VSGDRLFGDVYKFCVLVLTDLRLTLALTVSCLRARLHADGCERDVVASRRKSWMVSSRCKACRPLPPARSLAELRVDEDETWASIESVGGTNGLYALSSTDVNRRIVAPFCAKFVGVSSSSYAEYRGGS